jgi:GT2 family glycosyltransferase
MAYNPRSDPRLARLRRAVRRVVPRPPAQTQVEGREYRAWVAAAPAPTRPGRPDDPLMTIITAVHNPPPEFLREAISSVLAQSAGNWELILSDDGTRDPHSRRIIAEAVAGDARITTVRRDQAGGIVAALNDGMAQARGAYVGILDHDDRLHPLAIEIMTDAVRSDPSADLIYSDEDKITETGEHFDPFHKPGFSPELLVSNMYLNHFTVMRRALVSAVGSFRDGTDGAQDHDLALRMVRAGAVVRHVPGVLYHWRAWADSTASGIQAKPWAQVAAQRVQQAHLEAIGLPGKVVPSEVPGLNEVHYGIRGNPRVSVIIPTASRGLGEPGEPATLVEQCLRSLHRLGNWDNTEFVIVHTGPAPQRQARLFAELNSTVVTYEPAAGFNFSEAINLGAAAASGDYLLLLNDDTEVQRPGPIPAMLELAQLDGVGAVGARLSYPDGRNQHAGMLMVAGMPTHPFHRAPAGHAGYFGSIITPRNFLAVTGAALMTPRQTFLALGGLDPLWPRDFQDVDYCLRLVAQGLRVAYSPYAHFIHHESVSLPRQEPDAGAAARFRARWAARHPLDPNYSALLSSELSTLYQPL